MIEFMGRTAADIGEYLCHECMTAFDLRATDWQERSDYLEPKFCPNCGLASEEPTKEKL